MPKLLIIGYVWPEPKSSAAGTRMLQLIRFFLEQEYNICFATTASRTPYMADLESIGVHTQSIELNSASFDGFLKEFCPQVVLFDRFMMEEQFGWRVSESCPEAIKILDTEDLHFLRKARESAFRKGIELSPALLHSDTAKREIASIYRCDLSLIISETEMKLLQEHFKMPETLLLYLPLFPENNPTDSPIPGFEERSHFVSIGNFLHEPNWNAVLRLKKSIWPLIRKELPAAEIHIYGAYASQKVYDLHHPQEKFFIKGRADSAREMLENARVLLAPLDFGAGIKGKFIDSMTAGTPSVTTEIGAEGIAAGPTWPGRVENENTAFAKAAIALYTDPQLWEAAREAGYQLIEQRFDQEVFWEKFRESLELLGVNLERHREENFMGAMLQHHQLNSTRYLSKYIEAKNKLRECSEKKTPDVAPGA